MDDLIISVFYEIDNFCKEFIQNKRMKRNSLINIPLFGQFINGI